MPRFDALDRRALWRSARSVVSFGALPIVVTYWTVAWFVPAPPLPADVVERADQLLEARLPEVASTELEGELRAHEASPRLLRAVIRAHFRRPAYWHGMRRDDGAALALLKSETVDDPPLHAYAVASFELERMQPKAALDALGAADDKRLPELRLVRARAHRLLANHAAAVATLAPLLANKKLRRAAAYETALSQLALGDWHGLRQLASKPWVVLPTTVDGSLLLHERDVSRYVAHTLGFLYADVWWPYACVVLLGGALWLVYVRRIDLAGPAPLGWSAAAVVGGAAMGALVMVLAEAQALLFSFAPNGAWLHDLAYYVLRVGLNEELAKIIPVLLLARVSGCMRQPSDWLVYGALSGIGFATLESLHYAQQNPASLLSRTFLSTPFHMALTACVALAVPEAHARSRSTAVVFTFALLLASLVHGAFDFLLKHGGVLVVTQFLLQVLIARTFLLALGQHLAARSNREVAVVTRHTVGGLLWRSAVAIACFLYIALAARLPQHLRDAAASNALRGLAVMCVLALLYRAFEVPLRWSPDWWRRILRL